MFKYRHLFAVSPYNIVKTTVKLFSLKTIIDRIVPELLLWLLSLVKIIITKDNYFDSNDDRCIAFNRNKFTYLQ